MKIAIESSTSTEVTRERDLDEWDADDLRNSTDFIGIRVIEDEKEFFDLVTRFDIVPDREYYLVVGFYSTGDSFHVEEGVFELVELFETYEKARACGKKLKDHYEKESEGSVIIETETGDSYKFYPPWIGYFESLERVDIVNLRLVECPSSSVG